MNYKKDLDDFSKKMDLFSWHKEVESFEPLHQATKELSERTPLYIEMMAAAFLKETDLKASEVELVVTYGIDKITFYFQKRNNG